MLNISANKVRNSYIYVAIEPLSKYTMTVHTS